MHEILRSLPRNSIVLDLGCARGSFRRDATSAVVIRLDMEAVALPDETFVIGDAALLPFPDRSFAAVIANHSLEHVQDLNASLHEIGRVIRPDGCLFVSVPDASTFSDKLYRWLARGGGHINAFTSPDQFARNVERVTGLTCASRKTLCSSLAFLNRHNVAGRLPRRSIFVGAGYEWSLLLYTWLSRRLDHWLKLRTSIYGWAFYFGNNLRERIDTQIHANVCIRCGSASAASVLEHQHFVKTGVFGLRTYKCPCCGTTNTFSEDNMITAPRSSC